jgi:hypothetical protein
VGDTLVFTSQANIDPRARRPALDWLIAVVLLGLILLVVWFVWLRPPEAADLPSGGVHSQQWYVTTYGSDAGTIGRILAMSDCASLGTAFAEGSETFREVDTTEAENRASVGVMAAAADRMSEVGCPLE